MSKNQKYKKKKVEDVIIEGLDTMEEIE